MELLSTILFIAAAISAYYWKKYVFRKRLSDKELRRLENEPYLKRFETKRNEVKPPYFEYAAR